MNSNNVKHRLIAILKISAFLIFLGRAYQHLIWDAPYRAFLWDEAILKGIVENIFNTSWNNYVTSPTADSTNAIVIKIIGVFYLLCAIISLKIKPNMKKTTGQFFEYSIQFLTPMLLYMAVFTSIEFKKIRLIALVAIALTFSCHGLYAVGYYPRPGTFIDMTLNILPINEPSAHLFLKIAGVLDFVVAIAIFIPKISYLALIYAFVWGGLTAMARLAGHFYIDFLWNSFNQWTWEVLIRLPHALIPLFVITMNRLEIQYFKNRTFKNSSQTEAIL